MRLLIIANDQIFANKLKLGLMQIPLNIDVADSSEQGEYWARTTDYDLIITEHSQFCNAVEVCNSLRKNNRQSLLLVATESLSSEDAITLFNLGVDDYVSKFSLVSEMIARVKALLRRPPTYLSNKINIGDLTIDCMNYTVMRNDRSVHLTKKEFSLLEYLLRHKDRVLSRTDLIEHVWDINADLFSNSLETHILNLRKKLDEPGKPKLIETVSGRGYRIAAQT